MDYGSLRQKIVEGYRDGEPAAALAERFELPEYAIDNMVEEIRLAERKQKALEMREAGETYQAISKKVGISTRTLYQLFSKKGMVEHTGSSLKLTEEERRAIRYRRFRGEDVSTLSEEFGVTESYIYRMTKDVVRPKDCQPRLPTATKEKIAQWYLVDRIPCPIIADRVGASLSTIYIHRFKDPILEAEWHRSRGITYEQVKRRFRFSSQSMLTRAQIQEIWVAYHRLAYTMEDIAEKYGIGVSLVRSAVHVQTTSAYRAIWDFHEDS